MKYIDADLLRKEIEKRLKNIRDYMSGTGMRYKGPKYFKAQGKESAYDALLSIIDSLQQEQQEEPDKSLEEAAEEYEDWVESYSQSDFPTCVSFRQAFIAGAEYQKEQDTREMIKSDGGSFRRCYELGKKDMKEQMMKDAVVYVAEPETPIGNILIPFVRIDHSVLFRYGIRVGDKVRIIVLPKED